LPNSTRCITSPYSISFSQSRAVHLQHWRGEEVQRCSLLSIKTGGCSEDCAYCAQSAHYSTDVEREELLSVENVLAAARRARSQGAGRFCMGAAWRGVRDGSEKFERVLEIVREVSQLGMDVCVTLGEIGSVEARKLKAAGVTAYNHNIDTSPEFYPEIVRLAAPSCRVKVRRSAFLPVPIRFFTGTNFLPQKIPRLMSTVPFCANWGYTWNQ
jgi:biotin synthase